MAKALNYVSAASAALTGHIEIPGDKSISHRALMLGAIANGTTTIHGLLMGADNLATLHAMRDLGVAIEVHGSTVTVQGVGLHGLRESTKPLDLGNAGTAIRLLTGLLSGQKFSSTLIGDESLTRRPMQRIVNPLTQMGASIEMSCDGTPPLQVSGGVQLHGITYAMPIASAQVKSCILLAGLYAEGETTVIEPAPSRDHTERMLQTFSYPVKVQDNIVTVASGSELQGCHIEVPGDISSAAFFLVAASIIPNSDIVIKKVGINSTRVGVINILKMMGANIQLENETHFGAEPVADIRVRSAFLKGIEIPEVEVPLAIDEFPVLFIAAACAQGTTVLRGAKELRVKESDRLASMAQGLQKLGIKAELLEDGIIIEGGQLQGGEVESFTDHRIAMAFAVAGSVAQGPVRIRDCENVVTSFPNFFELANVLGMSVAAM